MKDPVFYRDFDYRKNLLPNDWLRRKEESSSDIQQAIAQSGATVGWPGWAVIYGLVLVHHRAGEPAVVVETGTNLGATSILIGQGLLDGKSRHPKLFTFESDPNNTISARENIEQAGLAHVVDVIEGDTRETLYPTLRDLLPRGVPVRLAFLDASHLRSDVEYEFNVVRNWLADDGLVVFDNTASIAEENDAPRVHEFLKELVEQREGNLVNFPFCSWYTPGLAVWQLAPFGGSTIPVCND